MKPYTECPQFERCSCNACPLDPEAHKRVALKGEEQCGANRSTRERIAAQYTELLPAGGLLPREVRRDARKAAWNALPEDHPRKLALARARALSPLKPVKNDPENDSSSSLEADRRTA